MCVFLDVVSTDRGVYTCNLHHHYCQIHQSVQIQLNVTKSGEMWTNTDIIHWLELQSQADKTTTPNDSYCSTSGPLGITALHAEGHEFEPQWNHMLDAPCWAAEDLWLMQQFLQINKVLDVVYRNTRNYVRNNTKK